MKILLIAPMHVSLDQIPEIRQLTSLHRTTVLNGNLTITSIFDEVRSNNYDIVHFATHLTSENNDQMYISPRETLGLIDTENILKLAKAKMVFLNFCSSARFATYLTNRGVDCAIYTTINVEDSVAWRFPIAFYEQLKRHESDPVFSFTEIYDASAPSDGTYGLIVGSKYYNNFLESIKAAIKDLEGKIDKLSALVSEHAFLLGTGTVANRVQNKYVILAAILFGLLILLASGFTVYSNISALLH